MTGVLGMNFAKDKRGDSIGKILLGYGFYDLARKRIFSV